MTEGIYDADEIAACPADHRILHVRELLALLADEQSVNQL